MDKHELTELLNHVADGSISPDDAALKLKIQPFQEILEVCSSRFPHSEISGSKDICSSPKLFAAYHVFHRLLVPRHPPYALISITKR